MPPISKDLVNHLTTTDNDSGQRLDNYLIKILKGVPKSHICRIIRAGEVRVDKKRAKPDTRLAAGQVVRIPPVRTAETAASSGSLKAAAVPPREFAIVFEDEALLVIDKPSGVAVHGGSGVDFGVIEQLRRARPDAKYLELVHRLDKDTSGLLMIAKKRSALVRLHEAIRADRPVKSYLALGVGQWPQEMRHVRLPLFKYTGAQGEKMVRVDESGQAAHTVFRVLDCFSGTLLHGVGLSALTLVEATLKTGRTHQIRVHMREANHPLAGDPVYGNLRHACSNAAKEAVKGLARQALHAYRLSFEHPATGETVSFEAPVPQDIYRLLSVLRLEAGLDSPLSREGGWQEKPDGDDDDWSDDDYDVEVVYVRD